jgi:hypothetical protein
MSAPERRIPSSGNPEADVGQLGLVGEAPGAPKIPMTCAFFEHVDDNTTVEIRIAKPKPKDREFLSKVAETFKDHITHEVEALRLMIEGHDAHPATIEEPPCRYRHNAFSVNPSMRADLVPPQLLR